jgi:hypothetical protein
VKVKVRARLFVSGGGDEIVEGILTNEPPEATNDGPELLVDGEATSLRYEVLSVIGTVRAGTR